MCNLHIFSTQSSKSIPKVFEVVFNEYIKSYLLDDPLLQPFIEKIKESSIMARKHKLKKNRQLLEKEKDIINKFGLDPNEIEDIFDLIENEE